MGLGNDKNEINSKKKPSCKNEASANQKWMLRNNCNDVNADMLIPAICWPPPFISKLFPHRVAPNFTAWLFFEWLVFTFKC